MHSETHGWRTPRGAADGTPDGTEDCTACGTAQGIACGTADGIAAAVRCALARPARLGAIRLVAVDGPSGSGKTSIAGPLAEALAAAVNGEVIQPRRGESGLPVVGPRTAARSSAAQADSSYSKRGATGGGRPLVAVVSTDLLATWEHPFEWWPTLDEHLLAPLAAHTTARLPVVVWASGNPRPGGVITVPPVDFLVLEGVSSGRRAVTDRLSALIWIEVADRGARLERAVARDGEAMRPQLARWQADEDAHFSADGTRTRADVVIAPDED